MGRLEHEYRTGQTMNHAVRRQVFRLRGDGIHDKDAARDESAGSDKKQPEGDLAADGVDLGAKDQRNNAAQLRAIEKNAILMTQP